MWKQMKVQMKADVSADVSGHWKFHITNVYTVA